MNSSSRIVGSLMTLLNPSNRFDQADLSSYSDRVFTGERRINYQAGPSILKLLATELTEIGKARSRGQVSVPSSI